jgi:tetratricopeptide (TPR) repeat protein
VLSKPQTRKEYDKSLTIAPSRLKATQDKARAAFEDGKLSMKEKDYKKAEILFGQAIYFDKTISDYHYYSGLNFMKLGRFKDAELALKEALRLEPFNPDYLAEFGFAMLALGMPLRAKSSFEKALKVAPQHKKALAGLTKVRNTQ